MNVVLQKQNFEMFKKDISSVDVSLEIEKSVNYQHINQFQHTK